MAKQYLIGTTLKEHTKDSFGTQYFTIELSYHTEDLTEVEGLTELRDYCNVEGEHQDPIDIMRRLRRNYNNQFND